MKIITPLKVKNRTELEQALALTKGRADIIELWLDVWENPLETLPDCVDIFEKGEFLAVCKTPEEKGSWVKSPVEKELVLQCFLDSGGRWIDLDINQNSETLIESFDKDSLVLSWHDFESIPENLDEWLYKFNEIEANIFKWALTPQTPNDLLRLLSLASKASRPFIFTTMGELGVEGREKLKPFTWGAFYALDQASTTASGQMTLDDL